MNEIITQEINAMVLIFMMFMIYLMARLIDEK
jgi:hypothetical protein